LVTVPEILKTALLTPGNYRGIAVTPVLSKILETIVKKHIEPTLSATQNPLQRGFTEKTSPTNATIIITEGIAEAKDNGKIKSHDYIGCRKGLRQTSS